MPSTVVVLHGFTQTGASWERVAALLPERYRPLAPDIRGHGTASDVEPASLEGVVQDIAATASGPFLLAGYSMGGRVALHVAIALGDRVQQLVLIGASPGIADSGERARRRADDERLADEIEGTSIEAFSLRWAQTPVLAGQSAEVAAAAHADRLGNTTAGLAQALRGLGTGALPSLWDRLGELEMPVTLVVGERDQKFRGIASAMAERLRFASVVVVPGAGHAVHLEDPAAVAAVIADL